MKVAGEILNLRRQLDAKDAEISMIRQRVEDKTLQLADASRLRDEVMDENDALRQEAADWRSAKYIAEGKETARALELIDVMKERDALLVKSDAQERCFRKMVKHVKSVINERNTLLKVREAADALAEAADVIRRIHLGDGRSGIKVAIEAYKEARDGMGHR